jgi:hypothetical protein
MSGRADEPPGFASKQQARSLAGISWIPARRWRARGRPHQVVGCDPPPGEQQPASISSRCNARRCGAGPRFMVIDQGREALPAQRFLRGRGRASCAPHARAPCARECRNRNTRKFCVGGGKTGGSDRAAHRRRAHTSLDSLTTRRGTDARRTQEPVAAPEIAEIGSLYGRREAKSRCDGAGY